MEENTLGAYVAAPEGQRPLRKLSMLPPSAAASSPYCYPFPSSKHRDPGALPTLNSAEQMEVQDGAVAIFLSCLAKPWLLLPSISLSLPLAPV